MPILHCYIDDDMERYLRQIANERGENVERLAEAAIENAIYAAGYRSPGFRDLTNFQRTNQEGDESH